MAIVRNLLVRAGADFSELINGMRNAQRKINGFSNSIGKSMGGIKGKIVGALAGLVSAVAIKGAVEDAMKYEALMGTLSESLGKSMADFEKWQNTVGSSLGYSKLQSAELANTLSLNFKAIATSQQDLTDKTTKMMETAALIASKRGMAMTEVSDRIRSAMNQEADGADELGVNVRASAIIQSNAYKQMANGTPWSELSTNMQKAILYHHILESVSTNLGDTMQNNTAMKMSAFTASLADVKLALGQAFLPILNVVLPVLTAFMRQIETALSYVAAFSRALFGGGAVSAVKQQTKATQKQTGAVVKLGNATDGTSKKAKKAAKAAKDAAKGSVAAFDEINQLADKADTSGAGASGGASGGGGSVSGGGGLTIPSDNGNQTEPKIPKWIQGLADKFKKYLNPLRDAWDRLKESFVDLWNSPAVIKIRKWLSGGWDAGIEGILLIVAGVVDIIAGRIDMLTAMLNGDWRKAWRGTGKMLLGFWEIITGVIGPIFPGLTKKMKKFGDFFYTKWNEIADIDFAEVFQNILKWFETMKKDGAKKWDDLKAKTSATWDNIKSTIASKMKEAWNEFTKPFIATYNWFKTNVIDKIASVFTTGKSTIAGKASDIWTAIKGKFAEVFNWFKTNVTDKIASTFTGAKAGIANKAGEIWTAIKGKFTEVYNWFKTNVVDKISSAFTNSKNGLASTGETVWNAIKSPFTSVYNWFKTNVADKISSALHTVTSGISDGFKGVVTTVINNGISLINSAISKLNSALQYIDKHFLPGDAIPKIPQIPKLAKGGITNGPTLALIGDNPGGQEVVSPLDKLSGIVTNAMLTALSFNKGSSANNGGDVVLNIDGRTFARIIRPYTDMENKRVGTNVRLQSI
ncbi:phage tail protein [Neobacillus vireti]|uniref:phage tail protein n=1 Tax=Neobacillus vireti TaxID=220686 RepID=UPI002FFEDDE6